MPNAENPGDGTTIHYEDDGGGGAPVTILGGFLDPIELVRDAPIARALANLEPPLRLIFVDHRGHGGSDKPHDPEAYAMPRRVADVTAVLDAVGVHRTHIVGISWGGRLGLGMAEHAPERIRSLVVIGQQPYAIDGDGPLARLVGDALRSSSRRGIAPLVETFESVAGRYPDAIRRIYLAADAAAMRAAWTAAMSEGAVSERLRAWDLPCVLCVAVDDVDFFEQARRAAEEIPGAVFVPIGGTDHLGVDTAPVDQILPAVLGVLDQAS